MHMTRIVIAHRRETLAMCDRIIDLTALNRDAGAPGSTLLN
jgi:ABC-type bacteriocin/lantibiotic exporter with double-glycine peptidase domain